MAKQSEMARIVDTLVSVSGYLAVRYPFGISGVLRSGALPGIFVFPPLLWPLCSRRPAMRRCAYVDLRHSRVRSRRGSLHRAFTVAHRSEGLAIPQLDSRRIAVRHTDAHRMEAV